MSYLDICITGWNLNALMFVVNLLIAIRTISTQDKSRLYEESLVLKMSWKNIIQIEFIQQLLAI